ncbi:hypothetical protein IPG41_05830 [Candidatus Peregrinibacteria bacterium]|nr:MAG: hypothetical protein IPG41_05830 [Candidatus Peregrinibacteria bacterium]
MKKILHFFLIFSLLASSAMLSTPRAQACSCVRPGTPAEELEASDVVFSGQVVGIDHATYGYDVTLQVHESWKGEVKGKITVHTGMGGGDCGFNFEQGKDYLVYASQSDENYGVSICGLTGLLADSDTESLGIGQILTQEEDAALKKMNKGLMTGAAVLTLVLFGTLGVLYAPKKGQK